MDETAYSISLRLQRTTTEYGYVTVPVTDDILTIGDNGEGRIDTEKFFRKGIELSNSPMMVWYPEDKRIEVHSIQTAPEVGEKSLPGSFTA